MGHAERQRPAKKPVFKIILFLALLISAAVLAFPLLSEYSITEVLEIISGKDSGTGCEEYASYSLGSMDAFLASRKSAVYDSLTYLRKRYSVSEDTKVCYKPNAGCYGETSDPKEIEAILNSAYAKQLIGEQKTVWSEQLPFIEGAVMKYYLDETILVLTWNEPVKRSWGTFTEVFLSDASQFRRKLVNDEFGCGDYIYPSELSEQVNAVCAVSGDLYDHPMRKVGVCVYDGVMERFAPGVDVCFVDNDGNFIMKKSNTFSKESEAEQFIKENDINFSLCFGPILIENGEDVSPDYYRYGEVFDDYPRLGISQMGHLHYFVTAINANLDTREYAYWGCDLDTLIETMLAHDCPNGYTLDGGQTGVILMDNEAVNPLQYSKGEQYVSDIIYFATAIPDK